MDVDGGRLYYEVAGDGYPLLLIHADVADCRMWDEQFSSLSREYRVIRFDKRGFGKTVSRDGTFSPRQDIADLLRHLGIRQTAAVGLSNGGQLAIDFTLDHPDMVSALIAVTAGVSGYEGTLTESEQRLYTQFAGLQECGDTAGLLELGVRVWADGPEQPAGRADASVRERVRAMLTEIFASHHERLEPLPLDPPAIGRLDEIRVPTLAIAGGLDISRVTASMRILAEGVPGAEYILFPDVAHMVNMERPAEFDAVVKQHLERLVG